MSIVPDHFSFDVKKSRIRLCFDSDIYYNEKQYFYRFCIGLANSIRLSASTNKLIDIHARMTCKALKTKIVYYVFSDKYTFGYFEIECKSKIFFMLNS